MTALLNFLFSATIFYLILLYVIRRIYLLFYPAEDLPVQEEIPPDLIPRIRSKKSDLSSDQLVRKLVNEIRGRRGRDYYRYYNLLYDRKEEGFRAVAEYIESENWRGVDKSERHFAILCALSTLLIEIDAYEALNELKKIGYAIANSPALYRCISSHFQSMIDNDKYRACDIDLYIDRSLPGTKKIANKIASWLCRLPKAHMKGIRRIIVVPKDDPAMANAAGLYYFHIDTIKLKWHRRMVPFYVRKRYRYSRQFVLYHEIGHFLYRHKVTSAEIEVQADRYAMMMLGMIPARRYYLPECMEILEDLPVAHAYPMFHKQIKLKEINLPLSFWGYINVVDPKRRIPEGFEPLMQLRCSRLPYVEIPREYAFLTFYIGHNELHIEPFTHEELSALRIGEKFLFNRESKPSKLVFRKFYREYPDRNDLAEEISGDMMEKCYHNYPHYEGSKCGGYPTWNRSETLCDFEGSDFLLQIDMRDVEGYDRMETTTFHIFYRPDKKIFHCHTSMF